MERTWGVAVFVALVAAFGVGLLLWGKPGPIAGREPPAVVGAAPTQSGAKAGANPEAAGASLVRSNQGGGVTVKVTWLGREAGPVFAVALDTHSVDLDGYDLRQLAVLQTDQGVEMRPSGWDAPAGGHHRAGTLSFPATTPDGAQVIGPQTKSIELTIRGVAGVAERTFRWDL